MTLAQLFTLVAVFAGFGFLIWSRLVKKNHPIVQKVKEWTSEKKEKIIKEEEPSWQHPNIERKIY